MESIDIGNWSESKSVNGLLVKSERIDPTYSSSYSQPPIQEATYSEQRQYDNFIRGQNTSFAWQSESHLSSQSQPCSSYIKSEFISPPQSSEVPTLTCTSEYAPTFTKYTEYPTTLPFSYTADFCLDGVKSDQISKESWDEESDDDEILEGEDREAVKLRRKLRKMSREKQKRSFLNDKFDDMCALLSLGKNTRVEKLTILIETIRNLEELTKEHNELKRSNQEIRSKIHAHQTGIPHELAQHVPSNSPPTEHQPLTPPIDKLDTTFCMDVEDLSLWDTIIEDDAVANKHKLFSDTLFNEGQIKLEMGEDSKLLYQNTEDMFADGSDVDTFFNVDENFNPFSFTMVPAT